MSKTQISRTEPTVLIKDNSIASVYNSDTQMEQDILTLDEMVMTRVGYKESMQVVKQPMFNVKGENPRRIQTHHGFWRDIVLWYANRGIVVELVDEREKMDPPKWQNVNGLRFGQLPLLEEALKQEDSGLIGAPTRYGKSYLMLAIIKAYLGYNTLVTAPGVDLVKQLYDFFVEKLGKMTSVNLMGSGAKNRIHRKGVTVCSMDSLKKCDPNLVDLMLIDEPHAVVTNTRSVQIPRFHKARKIGFGATLKGRSDNRDRLIVGLIGGVLANRTYREAVDEGAIAPIRVLWHTVPIETCTARKRETVYKRCFYENHEVGMLVRRICRKFLPEDWQTLLFINNEKQAEHYLDYVGHDGTIAMAKRLNKKERSAMTEKLCSGEIKRCIASNIYVQGVTFPVIRALINLAGGGANTSTIQKPGRLAEKKDGKKCGVMIDFNFVPADTLDADETYNARSLIRHSKARIKAYQEIGYEIVKTQTEQELEEAIKATL